MASLAPYSITLGATDYPVKYAGLLAYIEPYLTNLETFSFAGGNVGIGAASTGPKLEVVGDIRANTPSGTAAQLKLRQAGHAEFWIQVPASSSSLAIVDISSGTPFERLRLSQTGNLLLGTTADNGYRLDVAQSSAAMSMALRNTADASTNPTSSASLTFWRHFGINEVANIRAVGTSITGNPLAECSLIFGTSGGTGTATDRMTLNAFGNLGLGVTPSAWNTGYRALDMGSGALMAQASGADVYLTANAFFSTGGSWTYRQTSSAGRYTVIGNVHSWHTAPSGTAGNTISFTQAMTLTAGGAWWLGRTTDLGGAQILVEGSVADFQSRIRNTSATTPAGLFLHYTAAAPNGTGSLFLRCDDNAATRVEIRSNGGLANFSANNVNLSDARLKTDIELAGDYLAKVCAIPVKTFLYRDQQDDERNLGVIAQDVAAVAPELVDHSGFGQAPEGEAPYLAIYQTDLQYALMRAIQELAARVHELERA